VFAAARAAGALGVALSGAGPSVLAVARDGQAAAVAEAMRQALGRTGRTAGGVVLAADPVGARVERFCD
jgi:homoserine kinase